MIVEIKPIRNPYVKLMKNIVSTFSILQKTGGTYSKWFNTWPPKVSKLMEHWVNQGWYPNILEMKIDEFKGAQDISEGQIIDFYRNHLDAIDRKICEKFPNRQKIIRDAFNAHRRGEYSLSIPVLFAQIDGISYEFFEKYFFKSENNKPQTSGIIKDKYKEDQFGHEMSMPLREKSPVNLNERERVQHFTGLNRHLVMHGSSLDYDTEVNGLKAVSLIDYVYSVVCDISEM
jgi:hypothetical protein